MPFERLHRFYSSLMLKTMVVGSLLLLLCLGFVTANTNPSASLIVVPPNDLGLNFSHQVNKRENTVSIVFHVFNTTLQNYRYYYFDLRPFGYATPADYLPRQRLIEMRNSLTIVGLHDGDYVLCLTFVDEYENVFKPRYACYEFTFGEKTVGSHHGSRSGYLVPLLCIVAFILHLFIAIVHHIKAQNYAQKLLHRFIDVAPKSNRRRILVEDSLKQLDHPHISASVQRRLSRVSVDAYPESMNNTLHQNDGFHADDRTDELPLYTLPHQHHHSRRVSSTNTMQTIPEYVQSTMMESLPWTKRMNHSRSNSNRVNGH